MKVVVVDDNQALLSMIGLLLESQGHEAVLHESPIQAAFETRTRAFDVLITDVYMPQYNGVDLAQNVRLNRVNADIAVILISAHPNLEASVAGLGHKAAFLRKPFNSEQFFKALAKVTCHTGEYA